MAMVFSHDARGSGFGELAASGVSPVRLEQYRLDRLRELRAVIQTLRTGDGTESANPARFGQVQRLQP